MKKAWIALFVLLSIAWCHPERSAAGAQSKDEGLSAASVTVPFDFVDSRVVLRVKLNGRGPYTFVLDSGASCAIAPQAVTALGLKPTGSFTIGGTGAGRAHARRVAIASVALGPVTLRDQSCTDVDLDDIRKASALPAFDGLIGSELFEKYVVRIDYRAHVLTLTDPARYVYRGTGTVVPVIVSNGGIPRVAASLDGVDGTFSVDTGDRMAVTFMEPVIAREHLLDRYSQRVETITGWGIGGSVPGYVARAHDLRVGTLVVKEPLLRLPTVGGGFFTSRQLVGSIGTGITDRFTVTFDYAHKRLIFEDPAPDGRDPYDRSGLWLNQAGDGFEVAAVAPKSPAAAAGIATGDRVVAVNGISAVDVSLADVRSWLRADPGTRVTFTLDRAGARTDVPLTLQDLV